MGVEDEDLVPPRVARKLDALDAYALAKDCRKYPELRERAESLMTRIAARYVIPKQLRASDED